MDRSDVDARLRQITLLWFSLLGGVTMFTVVVVALTTGTLGGWSPSMSPSLAAKLMTLPFVAMAAGIFFRRGSPSRSGDTAARLTAYQNQVIIGAAMQEGGGLFGLVVSLLSGQPTWAVAVWVVTLVAMALTRPSRDELNLLLR